MRIAVPRSLRPVRLLVAAALIGCGGDSGTNPVDDRPASVVATSVVTQTVTVDRLVGAPPSVKVTNASGKPLAGVAVTFAVGMGGGTVTGAQRVTDANGIATVGGWGVGKTTGPNTLTATVAGLTPVTFTATATPDEPVRLAFVAQGHDGIVGAPLAPATEVQVLDQYDNRVTTSTATVTIALGSNPTGATLGGTTSAAAVDGVARFESLTIDKAGQGYSLVATADGLNSATSAEFAVATTSAARQWTVDQAAPPNATSVWTSGPTDVWVGAYGGSGGVVVHNDGAGWDRPASATTTTLSWVQSIWGSGPSDVYAAGKSLYHYDGTSWSNALSPCAGSYVEDVWGSGSADVWIHTSIGNDPASCPASVYHSSGGAGGFVKVDALTVPLGVPGYLALTGSGSGAVYLLGPTELVAVTSGGTTVTRYPLPSGFSARAIWAAAPGDVFVVGTGGRAYRFNGAAFTPMTTSTTADLSAIWGTAANDVYAGGTGVLLHFDGTSWSTEPSGLAATDQVSSIWGTTAAAPLYVVAGGKVLKGVR